MLFYSNLLAKTWRIWRIFTYKKLKALKIPNIQLLKVVAILVSVEIVSTSHIIAILCTHHEQIVLVIWSAAFTPVAEYIQPDPLRYVKYFQRPNSMLIITQTRFELHSMLTRRRNTLRHYSHRVQCKWLIDTCLRMSYITHTYFIRVALLLLVSSWVFGPARSWVSTTSLNTCSSPCTSWHSLVWSCWSCTRLTSPTEW